MYVNNESLSKERESLLSVNPLNRGLYRVSTEMMGGAVRSSPVRLYRCFC